MTIQKFILTLVLMITSCAFSQQPTEFNYSDSTYYVGQKKSINVVFSMVKIYYSETEKPSDLNRLYEFLQKHPKIKIEIIQHTDSRGSATANQNLSTKQAESSKLYLEEKGISPDRIIATGIGESEPIYQEVYINTYKETNKVKYEALHKANRRTIIKITAI